MCVPVSYGHEAVIVEALNLNAIKFLHIHICRLQYIGMRKMERNWNMKNINVIIVSMSGRLSWEMLKVCQVFGQ